MALRPDRRTVDTDIRHFMNSTAERGGIVCWDITGVNPSGAANDQSENNVAYVGEPSGSKPVGMLMNDVVDLDLTRQHKNWHKDEIQKGGKVTINPKGTFTTDWIQPEHTPSPGDTAYVGHSGRIATSKVQDDDTGDHVVGRFDTRKDEDGFAVVSVNLP